MSINRPSQRPNTLPAVMSVAISAVISIFFHLHAYAQPHSSQQNSSPHYYLAKSQSHRFIVSDNQNQTLLSINAIAFKPQWQWLGITSNNTQKTHSGMIENYTLDNGNIQWQWQLTSADKAITLNSQLQAKHSTPLTYIALSIEPTAELAGGRLVATDRYQRPLVLSMPLRIHHLKDIVRLQFHDKNQKNQLTVELEQAVDIHIDGSIRLKLADKIIPAETKINHQLHLLTEHSLHLYHDLTSIPKTTGHQQWFPWTPAPETTFSATSLHHWLKVPNESLTAKGGSIYSATAKHKVWGTNVEFSHNAPSKTIAKRRARFFAKHGINSVRLHKISNPGWQGVGSDHSATDYDPKKMLLFDHWTHQLKQHGITYGLSPIWMLQLRPGDKDKVLAYDEIVKLGKNHAATTGLVWFAEDIQKVHINNLLNLLNHENAYTKQRYADDPAVAFIEIQNEENIFFYTFMQQVRKYPTYHKMLAQQFSEWLRKKYGNHRGLVTHWGHAAINTFNNEGGLPNENLGKNNIVPVLTPWLYDHHASSGIRARRLQDSALFLFEKQQAYYRKATKALREIGYKGLIVSSNWQAGSKGAHFLNLLGDSQIGVVDRHNYQGGAKGNPGHTMKSGFELNNYTMLGAPGSGLLSLGMQQVADHPFMVSEWLAVAPSEWAAADTTIVAAYGFGLLGWDMSYHFASNGDQFTPTIDNHDSKFNNLTPVGLGLYPVLSRMVLRGDITEGKTIATRRLSQQQAVENRYDFSNSIEQEHDIKSFNGTPDHSALAAGKVLIEFTKNDANSTFTSWQKHYKTQQQDRSVIESSTEQLRWTAYPKTQTGYIEINSAGTQGFVGFHDTENDPVQFHFNDLSITPQSPYSVILTTAKAQDKVIANDNELIIVAIARAHNTDMNLTQRRIINVGQAPVLLEPVKAILTFKRKTGIVEVLDHNGVPTGKQYPLKDGAFELDTVRDKTIYYRVKF